MSTIRSHRWDIARAATSTALALILTGTFGCFLFRRQPERVVVAVDNYMRCVECTNGELSDLVALGDTAVPLLRQMLVGGPPHEQIEALRESMTGRGLPPTSPGTLALQIAEFKSLYRQRSADALGAIGTATAKRALCDGRGTPALGKEDYDSIDSSLMLLRGMACP